MGFWSWEPCACDSGMRKGEIRHRIAICMIEDVWLFEGKVFSFIWYSGVKLSCLCHGVRRNFRYAGGGWVLRSLFPWIICSMRRSCGAKCSQNYYIGTQSTLRNNLDIQYHILLVLWWGIISLPWFSISFIVSYKKKSNSMAFTLVSGWARTISRRINSTHHTLHPRICISQGWPLSIMSIFRIRVSRSGLNEKHPIENNACGMR